MVEGYWRISEPTVVTLYHITKVSDRLRMDYHCFLKGGDASHGTFDPIKGDEWSVPVESITEKEYFLAVLRGGGGR